MGVALGVGPWLNVCVRVGEELCDAVEVTLTLRVYSWLVVLEVLEEGA